MKLLTVCCPVLNESTFIDGLLQSIINASPLEKEIILIDGGSTDDTLEKIMIWQKKHLNIRVIPNKLRYVSHGFNLAYKNSQSKYITLMGSHSEYPPNYFEVGLSLLENGVADAVGGPLNQVGKTEKGRIIAACMSSRFGVGNAEFRTSKKRAYVRSVAMAIYKRSVFEEIGLLDEELVINQDDEFHYRLNSKGYKILMEPAMEVTYYVRDDIKSLWKQYFNYGLYKPLVIKKVNSGLRFRHLVPPIFVFYLIIMPFLLLMSWLTILPLIVYFFLALGFSTKISCNLKHKLWALTSFFVLHVSSGIGMLLGLVKLR
jgi:succinoglycan biosynthesis protein ExoA